jgi:uncharacterized protein
MTFPIPDAALDDRLAILGTAGSGKTYLTTTAIERLLTFGARTVNVDPLGVMWGLRLKADGKTPSGFNLPIFGGRHGDLPLTEHAGSLIGETVATMRESCIVDLSELPTKAAERRFMTAFLESIYRHTDPAKVDPYHLIIDEADRFAPQKPPAGDETMLNRMEEIVRRGRVKGFIPWLITQRPAVLNKNVLSQADGLVLLKLTSSQDRDQVGAWIEGQADRAQGKAILGSLPAMQRGQGVVWIPGRGMLSTVQFPRKTTFDSSSAPKRGEKRNTTELKPLDLGKLKDKLATVEAESKANDPKALKAEIARLNSEIRRAGVEKPSSAPKDETAALKDRERAFQAGERQGYETGYARGWQDGDRSGFSSGVTAAHGVIKAALPDVASVAYVPGTVPKRIPDLAQTGSASTGSVALPPVQSVRAVAPAPVHRAATARAAGNTDHLPAPQRRVLASIGFWLSVGNPAPSRAQVGGVAGYSPSSGGFNNLLGALNTAGLITIPKAGHIALAADAPYDALTAEEARNKVYSVISAPQRRLVDAALAVADAISRDDLGAATGYSPSSGGFNNLIGSLNTLTIFEKPSAGMVRLSDWAREVLS